MILLLALLLFATPPDTLHLAPLQQDALQQDPRTRQLQLEADVAQLNVERLTRQYWPQLSAQGQASYQSDVTSFGGSIPNVSTPSISKDQYQIALNVDQLMYDGGGVSEQRTLERIQRDLKQASARAERYRVKEQVNQAFFAVLLLQAQAEQLRVLEEDLQAKRRMMAARVQQGAALSSSVAAIEAELVEVAQQQAQVRANRQTAWARLEELTGRSLPDGTVLAPPDVTDALAQANRRLRPEYAVFEQQKRQLEQQAELAGVELHPRVSAFVQGGYGRPGLNRFDDRFQTFWQAGLRVQWNLWDWGQNRRTQEALAVRQRIVETQETTFSRTLRLTIAQYRNDVDRLKETLTLDERLVKHRQTIEQEAASQLENGVITTADYLEKRHDVFRARLQRRTHHLQLQQARVGYLTTIGAEVREEQ